MVTRLSRDSLLCTVYLPHLPIRLGCCDPTCTQWIKEVVWWYLVLMQYYTPRPLVTRYTCFIYSCLDSVCSMSFMSRELCIHAHCQTITIVHVFAAVYLYHSAYWQKDNGWLIPIFREELTPRERQRIKWLNMCLFKHTSTRRLLSQLHSWVTLQALSFLNGYNNLSCTKKSHILYNEKGSQQHAKVSDKS